MVGFLYLVLAIIFGCSLILRVCNVKKIYATINEKMVNLPEFLFVFPAGSCVGILLVAFFNYFLIYVLRLFLNIKLDKIYIIALTITGFFLFISSIFNFIYAKECHKIDRYYLKVILYLILATSLLIFYGYFMRDGKLYLGPTIHSDLSPHTALVESFGNGGNIPTSYPHFSNDGIRYYFFFYFFAGILKFLGMRLDMALNIPTIIGIVSALMLVGLFANLLSSSKKAYFWAPTLILFRSSFAIFDMIKGKPLISLIGRIVYNDMWYDTTPYDEWGLWAINVYANQRHLMISFAILLTVVMLFLPYVKSMFEKLKNSSFMQKMRYLFTDINSWKIQDFKLLILLILSLLLLFIIFLFLSFSLFCLARLFFILFLIEFL